ncbi:MAG TPA: hypothetical protein VI874_02850 [Candidatus Norongarragalinales archaeon]|nr:hypothetical protein [Candidatus Norongarragalinales archaeon]
MAKSKGSENKMQQMGSYAFIGGSILSVLLGVFVTSQAWMLALLAILGLIVALVNITDEEVTGYLIANIAVLVGSTGFNAMLVTLAQPLALGKVALILQTITGNLVFFVAPGAVLIALKEVYKLASSK